MCDIGLKCRAEDGTNYNRRTITNNEDHVANYIAEGQTHESDRWKEIARLYKGQLAAKQRELNEAREQLRKQLN